VGGTAERARLRFEVTDTGIGIDPKAQARIFDSFVQADETIIDRFGGTGLGLALVKQLVQLQGGEIGVESAPGVGTTFWCEVEFETASPASPAWSARGMPVVLLSDDDELRGLLSATGADASMVNTFAEAAARVAQWAEKGRRPAVLLDARLVGDGVRGTNGAASTIGTGDLNPQKARVLLMLALTRTVAREMARKGVTCNAVTPGVIDTDMTADVADKLVGAVPAGRVGRPEEVAACVAFLCSEEAAYVNGAMLAVDGGLAA